MEPIGTNYNSLKNEADSILNTVKSLEYASGKVTYNKNSGKFQGEMGKVGSAASYMLGTWYTGSNYDTSSFKEGLTSLKERITDFNKHLTKLTLLPSAEIAQEITEITKIYAGVQSKLLEINTAHMDPEEQKINSEIINELAKKIGQSLKLTIDRPATKLKIIEKPKKSEIENNVMLVIPQGFVAKTPLQELIIKIIRDIDYSNKQVDLNTKHIEKQGVSRENFKSILKTEEALQNKNDEIDADISLSEKYLLQEKNAIDSAYQKLKTILNSQEDDRETLLKSIQLKLLLESAQEKK